MARRLAREEGLLLGYSAGSAMAGLIQLKDELTPEDVVVVIIHDHGSRYVGKIYNDDWMRERGFLDTELRVVDLIKSRKAEDFIAVQKDQTVRQAFQIMKDKDISQLPVMEGEEIIGGLTESTVLSFLLDNPLNNGEKPVSDIMDDPFPVVQCETPLSQLRPYLNKRIPAVITKTQAGTWQIVTQYDILQTV